MNFIPSNRQSENLDMVVTCPAFPADWSWKLFAGADIPDGLFDNGERVGEVLNLPDGRQIRGDVLHFPSSGVIDLNTMIHPRPPVGTRAVLMADFIAEKKGKAIIGIGADWWLILRLNGEVLEDNRKTGNCSSEINPENYLIEFSYHAGRNQLVYEVFSGAASFQVAARLMNIEPLELCYRPWAGFPDAEYSAMTVTFRTRRSSPAGVDWRRRGDSEWRRCYDNLGGQIRRDRACHTIRLAGLVPDCEYEYRVVLFDESNRMREYALPEIYRFRSPPDTARNFSFCVTGDLQINDDERLLWLEKFLGTHDGKTSDFFVYLGDVDWVHNFDRDYIEKLVVPFQNAVNNLKPLVVVRGNHETYGKESHRFFEYFPAPEPGRDGYYIFRWGGVCFIVLDCGDDYGRQSLPSFRAFHDWEPYIDAQAAWLRNVVNLPACRNAQYRIVLAHGLPVGDFGGYMPEHIRKIIDPVFAGKNPACRIHLWLGGHVHYVLRSIPGCNAWRCGHDLQKLHPLLRHPQVGVQYGFPVLAVSGPLGVNPPSLNTSSVRLTVSKGGITVESSDSDGNIFDSFTISPDATVTEQYSAEWFKTYGY